LILEPITKRLAELLLGVERDLLGRPGGVHLDDAALLVVVVNDGHARLNESTEPLADRLGVVVGPAGRLAALEQAALHLGLGAVVEQDQLGRADNLLKLERLVHLAREPIDQEAALVGLVVGERLGHGVFEQGDRHLHGHDVAVLDAVLDELAELGAGPVLLGAQEVAGGQVGEAVIRD